MKRIDEFGIIQQSAFEYANGIQPISSSDVTFRRNPRKGDTCYKIYL